MFGDSEITRKFLNCITYHLSGKEQCKGVEYYLAVGLDPTKMNLPGEQIFLYDSNSDRRIHFSPDISLFESRHVRKPGSQVPVLSHVIRMHFRDELFDGTDQFGNILVKKDVLVPGVYKYTSNTAATRRRWVKEC